MTESTNFNSDATLLLAVASGNQAAVADLYDRYVETLMALALRLLRDPAEAEDIVHDVFVEAWRQAHTYDPARSTVRSWLLMRLRSRALDRLRSAPVQRNRSIEEESVPDLPAPADSGPDQIYDQARVRQGLDRLPPEQRAVVELAYFSGLSASEISKRMSVPVGTVKSRMAAALQRLRSEVGPGLGGWS